MHAPSVKALKRAIDGKRCRVNGRVETFSTYKLSKRDRVEIEVVEGKVLKLLSLFEDEFLLICNKPAGLVCEPKNFPAKLVHRLDKETSGVLILAKKESVRHQMIELFAKRLVLKEYVALVDGNVLKKEGRIESRLSKRHGYEGQTIFASGAKGEEAITEWMCLGNGEKAALLLCKPITGRTHQLRVHLKEMGHPILGDTQYSKRFSCSIPISRHLLHALRISFPHPVSGIQITSQASLPEDFLEALEGVGMVNLVELP